MKKLISLICVILLLASFCTLAVSAGDNVVVIADDFDSLAYCSSRYVRVENGDSIDYENSEEEDRVILTKRQQATVRHVEATVDADHNAYVVLDVRYKTGGTSQMVYVNSGRLEEYDAILNGSGDLYTTRIDYETESEIVMSQDQLQGETIVLDGDAISHVNTFTVWVESEDGYFSQVAGEILKMGLDDEFYYVDYFQKGTDGYYDLMMDLGSCEDVTLHHIEDEELLERIEMDYAAYYDAQMLPYTENVGRMLSAVMMVIIFGVLPLAVIVVSIIGWIRSKRALYRRLFASMVCVGAAELTAFVTACIMCILNR